MTHEELYDAAFLAIQNLHGDKSVSLEKTLYSLQELKGELDALIELIEDDIERRL